jgi:hypothetical protein
MQLETSSSSSTVVIRVMHRPSITKPEVERIHSEKGSLRMNESMSTIFGGMKIHPYI